MFSERQFQELVRELNRRDINLPAVWRAFAKLGAKESYDRLYRLLDSPDLEKWQVVNALNVLIELRHLSDQEKRPLGDLRILFDKILELSTDQRILVRSVAIGLAIEFTTIPSINQHHGFDSATRANVEPVARKAFALGLSNPHALIVKEFLGIS